MYSILIYYDINEKVELILPLWVLTNVDKPSLYVLLQLNWFDKNEILSAHIRKTDGETSVEIKSSVEELCYILYRKT